MNLRPLVVTGTDTGVGKTTLAVLLVRRWRRAGLPAVGLKPVCSGSRADARRLHAVTRPGGPSLEEINPWHFASPVTPMLAARECGRLLRLGDVVQHIDRMRHRFGNLIIEGAGGLLSPLGEDFSTRELIIRLSARVVVVAPNRLGALNQVRLTIEALPRAVRCRTQVVLVAPRKPDRSTLTNAPILEELLPGIPIRVLPRVARGRPSDPRVGHLLDRI